MEEDVGRPLGVGVEVGEQVLVAPAERRTLMLLPLDPAEPLGDVPLPDRLAELAVVDDVDPGLDLPAHDVRDGRSQLLLRHFAHQRRLGLRRPLERPDVGGQDPCHRVGYPPSPLRRWLS